MEHAKRMVHKLFNYQFKNESNKVKTANLMDYYIKMKNKESSTPINNMDIWSNALNCWVIKYYKLQLKSHQNRTEFFNKSKILSYYRDSFDYMIQQINITLQYRVPAEHNETNFETITFLYNDYKQFLRMLRDDRLFKLDEHKVITKEVPSKPYEVITKQVSKKYVKPIQHFKEVLQYRKGFRGLRKVREYY